MSHRSPGRSSPRRRPARGLRPDERSGQPGLRSRSPTPTPTSDRRADPVADPDAEPDRPTPTPLSNVGDLTGLPVDPAIAHRLPLAVMIDDSRAARPQSGFNGASIVYQSLADGYESRYLLIFQEGESKAIGPVRSARFFLVQWSSEVAAAFAHYGGDRRTREYIAETPLAATSVDGLGKGNSAYKRLKSRRAPHNAYTTTNRLRATALKIGAPASLDPAIHRRPFVDPSPVAERAARQTHPHPVQDQRHHLRLRPRLEPVPALGRRQAAHRPGRRQAGDDDERRRPLPEVPHRHQDRARALAPGHHDHRQGQGARLPRGPRRRGARGRRPATPTRPSSWTPTARRSRWSAAGRSSRSSRRRPR